MSPSADVAAVQRMTIIPKILETVAQITALRFICIARAHPRGWTACAVLDQLGLGLRPNDTLELAKTLFDGILAPERPIIIERSSDALTGAAHHASAQFGFESFISVPIMARGGVLWGTLFGIDSLPRALSEGASLASMTLFSALISQQLKIQEELEDTRVALMDATATTELREQFIAVLGHDLRNPIGNVITSAELMMLSLDNPERLTVLAKLIQGSARRMAALVDDVVDLTRGKLGGGMGLSMRRETDLCGAIALVVNELRSSYPARDIRFEAVDGGAVMCDGGRLAQLCSNLLKNALVYGDPSQPVTVSILINDAGLELAVSNHGPQMSADTISHLFEPYWRAKGRSAHQGLGLGLFIVGEIASRHGGVVSVVSSPELTTFLFKLGSQADAGSTLSLRDALPA